MHYQTVTPFEQWMRDNIYGKLAPSAEIKELMALAFEGGQKALEQPAQEPVAWINEDELPDEYPYDEMFKHSEIVYGVRVFPVYPPKHQWQGLTDDEIDAIIKEKDGVFGAVVRAIEQALKEKNHG